MNPIEVQVSGGQGIVPSTYKTIVLKPNIVNGKNMLTQAMFAQTDTKYVIKYDYIIDDDIVTESVQVLSSNISQCVNPAYTNALATYNEAHDAWIDADNAYTNNPNDTTLAAKNAAYAAYTAAQTTLNNTPQFYYYAANAILVKQGQHISIPKVCILLNASLSGITDFVVAPADTTVYIGSLTAGEYNYTVQNAIVIPSGCLIEFDGGSISNGVMVGNKTILIFDQEEEVVLKNVELLGDFEYSAGGSGGVDKKDNVDGMATITLKKNKSFASQLTQPNTIYRIMYDFDLGGESVTIPENCVLKFDGGSLDNGVFYGNKCKVLGTPKWGDNITYCDIYDNDGAVLYFSKVTNKTYFGEPTNTDVDVLTNLNAIIEDIANTYGEVTLVFEKDVTYDFGQTILLRDNMTVDGNGCTIQFHTVKNENGNWVTMYPYSAFFTNRKLKSTGLSINEYAVDVLYGEKNITIKNINFIFTSESEEFFFYKNSERGMIAINSASNIRVENCTFNDVYMNYPIWVTDVDGIVVEGCEMTTNFELHDSRDTCGLLWCVSGYVRNVEVAHNKAVCYNDEVVCISNLSGTLKVHDNDFTSIEQVSITILEGASPEIYIEKNIFSTISPAPVFDPQEPFFSLAFEDTDDRNLSVLSVKDNIYNYCYGVLQMMQQQESNIYMTIDKLIVEGNKFIDGVCGVETMRVKVRYFRFSNNYCAKGIKAVTSIGLSDAFAYIVNNETGIIKDSDASDLSNLPINNSISCTGTTIVSGNVIYGGINFYSSAYITSLVFNGNNCTHGYFNPLSNKRNAIVGNFFRNHYMQLAPEEDTKFGNNIVVDSYGNLLNDSSYTISAIDSRLKYHSIGDLILVDERLARVTSEGYSFVDGQSGAELSIKLNYVNDKTINSTDYSFVAFNAATKVTLTDATFADTTTEKDFEGYQEPSSSLSGNVVGSPFIVAISNKAAVKQLIINANDGINFSENFKISNLRGATGLEKIQFITGKAIGDISSISSILPSLTSLWLVGTNITGNLALLASCIHLGNDWSQVANQSALHGDLSSIPGNVVNMNLPSWTKDTSLLSTGYQGLTWTPGVRQGSDKSILCLNSASSDQRFASSEDVDNYFIDNATCSFNGGEHNSISLFVLSNYTPSAAASTAIATLKTKGVTEIKVNLIAL